ncbi:NAD(P)-dependent oxidoreductase [Streptomyces sp. DSM 44915]|uniref:NAD(P)-dependent oxidoreductase n=1 Tax=Streptomyces chisholmiae TaxID=3075540 RepID=A0ABU2JSF1_9ACTN|nr:NAD(P)-dependent oxidoreductase [Streptomyces sp. DSM 44915]MDT0267643.1 NAD(P)-dependent oxidoreductase [Streptomyces sp. DSM 44915]
MRSVRSPQLIGFPRESTPGDRRTLLTPVTARALAAAGFEMLAEPGLGEGTGCPDSVLAGHGVRFAAAEEVWAAPLVLRYKNPDPSDLARLAPGQAIAALFHAEGSPAMLAALTRAKVTAYSYELLTENGRFPLGTAGGTIAGIQAVHVGARALQHPAGRGVLLGGVPGADPARVVVIGSGNVGSAAARTAAALDARVTVLTRTPAAAAEYRTRAPVGVTVEVNSRQRRAAWLPRADLVIGAILISTHDTPPMITETDLARMPPGAVVVDATCGYGPGYLPTAGPVQAPGDPPHITGGILHVKLDTLPALVPVTASRAYAAAAAPYLVRLAHHALAGRRDEAVGSAVIARDGALVHAVCERHAAFYRTGATA